MHSATSHLVVATAFTRRRSPRSCTHTAPPTTHPVATTFPREGARTTNVKRRHSRRRDVSRRPRRRSLSSPCSSPRSRTSATLNVESAPTRTTIAALRRWHPAAAAGRRLGCRERAARPPSCDAACLGAPHTRSPIQPLFKPFSAAHSSTRWPPPTASKSRPRARWPARARA